MSNPSTPVQGFETMQPIKSDAHSTNNYDGGKEPALDYFGERVRTPYSLWVPQSQANLSTVLSATKEGPAHPPISNGATGMTSCSYLEFPHEQSAISDESALHDEQDVGVQWTGAFKGLQPDDTNNFLLGNEGIMNFDWASFIPHHPFHRPVSICDRPLIDQHPICLNSGENVSKDTQELDYLSSIGLGNISMDLLTAFPPAFGTDGLELRYTEDFSQLLTEFNSSDANSGRQTLETYPLDFAHRPTIPLSPTSPSSGPPTYLHSKRKGERSIVDPSILSRAFTDRSSHLNIERRVLLEKILGSPFYLKQEHEPQLDAFGAELLADMPALTCITPRTGSIFSLFVDLDAMLCLFCDKVHSSVERAIGCVRSHIGHRPFACGGGDDGCKSCTRSRSARFFARSHLRDHINRQKHPDRCQSCNASIRIGNIRRHYESMHPSEPFPDMKTQRKRERRAACREAGSSRFFSPY